VASEQSPLCPIESDFTLTTAVELALKDEVFYDWLKAMVVQYLQDRADKAA
jgi:hypothetical protein